VQRRVDDDQRWLVASKRGERSASRFAPRDRRIAAGTLADPSTNEHCLNYRPNSAEV
jgi:hypothetical protein